MRRNETVCRGCIVGSIALTGVSGLGSQDLGGYQQVLEVDTQLTTLATLGDIIGTGVQRWLRKQGRWELSALQGGVHNYVVVDHFIDHEAEAVFVEQSNPPFCNTLYWDLQVGAVLNITVYWV